MFSIMKTPVLFFPTDVMETSELQVKYLPPLPSTFPSSLPNMLSSPNMQGIFVFSKPGTHFFPVSFLVLELALAMVELSDGLPSYSGIKKKEINENERKKNIFCKELFSLPVVPWMVMVTSPISISPFIKSEVLVSQMLNGSAQ